jgi:hypothetical protein
MAIAKLGATVVGLRGTIGGITYSANRSGPYAKSWSTPRRRATPRQQTVRTYPSFLATSWQALTPVQRAAWATYAAAAGQAKTNSLGQTYYASGWNWYLQTNSYCLIAGIAIQAAPPALPGVTLTAITVQAETAGPVLPIVEINAPIPNFNVPHWYACWIAYVPNSTILVAPKQYKQLAIKHPNTSVRIDLRDNFTAIWGTPITGWRVFAKCVLMSTTGRQTTIQLANTTVIA